MPPKPRFLIIADGDFAPMTSKTANSVIRYLPDRVVGVVDRVTAGKTVQDVLGFGVGRVFDSLHGPVGIRVVVTNLPDKSDYGAKIRPGDVVVCPVTSPVWSVVFPSMGALVTDSGGILSHPAIIAREHGVPAIVGTGNATDILEDGQRVTVDGNTGVVELDYLTQGGKVGP